MRTLYYNAYIITMEEGIGILEDGALLVNNNLIEDIGNSDDMLKKYTNNNKVDFEGKIMLPGFVNTHTHSVLTVLKGLAEDVNTIKAVYGWMTTVNEIITEEDSYILSRLGQLEILSSGSTTIVENSTKMNGVAKASEELGNRIVLSAGKIHDYELEPIRRGQYIYNKEIGKQTMEEAMLLIEKWNGKADGRITCNLYPHATETCSMEILKEIASISKNEKMGVTLHMAQNTREVQRIREVYDKSPIEYMESVGLLNRNLISAHCVFLEDSDIELMGNVNSTLAHCPVIINKRGFTAPTLKAKKEHVNISLGTDNMFGDIIDTMRYVLTSSRIRTGIIEDFTSKEVLEMATLNGARAIGREDDLGSLKIGKIADFIILNKDSINLLGYNSENIYDLIVLYCDGSDVEKIYVDGKKVLDKKVDTDLISKVIKEGLKVSEKIWSKLETFDL
ncbi:MAG: amidohydrolase family protein [Tissierellia bacterium]|nr:amidohydrolase family protein [Tissierellia bacterium]